MSEGIHVAICETALSLERAAQYVDAPQNGALNMFIGRVRNHNLGRPVEAVSYDAFTPLACKIFEEICQQAIRASSYPLRCFIEHYKGRLEIGGMSVVIAVGSPHRDESFAACRSLIEELKIRAPIWKQEHYVEGDSEWMKGHALAVPSK
jgi:molybdopterin synthase catalytic subunit